VTTETVPPAAVPVPKPKASLKSRVLRAGSWTMVGHLTSHVLRLASSLFMTRLLVPEMFGVIALAAVVQAIISLLSDIGLRQAIIQSPRGEERDMLDTAWTLQAIRGWFIWGLCGLVAAGLWFARYAGWLPEGSVYASPDLAAVIAVSGISAAVMGFQSTKAITVNRNLDLKRVTFIELISQIAGLLVMATLGWWTRSIWSIVSGGVVASFFTVALSHLWLPGPNNRFHWDARSVKELVGYGRWVLMSSSIYVLASSGDRLFLGGKVDPTTLGLYSIALNLTLMVEGAGTRLFASVAMPALSEVARDAAERFRALYYRLRLPFDLAFVGSAGVFFAMSQTIIDVLYDPRYAAVGPMLQALSFSLVFARYGLAGNAYLALGQPRHLMWVQVVKLISVFTLMPLGYALYGVQGALYGLAFHQAPTLPLLFFYNAKYKLNNWRFELLMLLAWPVGVLLGSGMNVVLTAAKALIQ
jgi:O-antigen/teichoic acid export membrane protein